MRFDTAFKWHSNGNSKVSIPIGFSNALRRDIRLIGWHGVNNVSIPIGFSNALRPVCVLFDVPGCGCVSIPIGFSNALRHLNPGDIVEFIDPFQSLLGFPMRCDPS